MVIRVYVNRCIDMSKLMVHSKTVSYSKNPTFVYVHICPQFLHFRYFSRFHSEISGYLNKPLSIFVGSQWLGGPPFLTCHLLLPPKEGVSLVQGLRLGKTGGVAFTSPLVCYYGEREPSTISSTAFSSSAAKDSPHFPLELCTSQGISVLSGEGS